jgi:hypothetical protein
MNWPEFHHEAMATTFAVVIADHPRDYARQAAAAAYRELDRLESELSRYIESSDIARANRLACGETISIGEDTLQCLLIAADVSIATGRAFDAAYASQRAPDQPADAPLFTLDPDAHTLTSRAARLHLDLGAVGKGYALDRMAAQLTEWAVTTACLQSGGSTALALARTVRPSRLAHRSRRRRHAPPALAQPRRAQRLRHRRARRPSHRPAHWRARSAHHPRLGPRTYRRPLGRALDRVFHFPRKRTRRVLRRPSVDRRRLRRFGYPTRRPRHARQLRVAAPMALRRRAHARADATARNPSPTRTEGNACGANRKNRSVKPRRVP